MTDQPWSDREQAIYDVGYRDGESSTTADWIRCPELLILWDGEGELECSLPAGHDGPHRDVAEWPGLRSPTWESGDQASVKWS